MTRHNSEDSDNSWAWLLLGLAVGGAAIYAATRPKIEALEKRTAGLERQVAYLHQTVTTMQGHLRSLQGFLAEQQTRLQALERQVVDLDKNYDAFINDLEFVEQQLTDEQAKKALKALLERAKRRKATRLQTLSN